MGDLSLGAGKKKILKLSTRRLPGARGASKKKALVDLEMLMSDEYITK